MLNPDCGFATFADNPIASSGIAEMKLAAIVEAARIVRRKYRLGRARARQPNRRLLSALASRPHFVKQVAYAR